MVHNWSHRLGQVSCKQRIYQEFSQRSGIMPTQLLILQGIAPFMSKIKQHRSVEWTQFFCKVSVFLVPKHSLSFP